MSSKNVPDIQEVQNVIMSAKPADNESDARTELERKNLELERMKAELKSLKNDIAARQIYAGLIYLLVVAWLGAILWIIIATGSGWYKLADTVLVALITSTTVTAFLVVVARYLFPSAKTN